MLKLFFLLTFFVFTLNANVLRVGYSTNSFNELSKKDSQIVLNLWFEDMMKSLNHSAKFTFYDDITLMAEDFDSNKLDLIFANGMELVKYFNISKMQGAFTGGAVGKNADNLVEVRRKSTSKEFLKRQKILRISLLKGETPSQVYAKSIVLREYKNREVHYISTKKNSAALLKLFFNQSDIAIVPKKTFEFAIELNPQIGIKLEVMHQTNITLATLGYFNKNTDVSFRDKVTELAFKVVQKKRGKQMLLMFKTPKLMKVNPEQLIPIRKLYKEYLKLERGI